MTNWLQKAECLPGCAAEICAYESPDFGVCCCHKYSHRIQDWDHPFQPAPCDCGRVQAVQEWGGMVKFAADYVAWATNEDASGALFHAMVDSYQQNVEQAALKEDQ